MLDVISRWAGHGAWGRGVKEAALSSVEMEKVVGGPEGNINKLIFGHIKFDTLTRHPSTNIKQPVGYVFNPFGLL